MIYIDGDGPIQDFAQWMVDNHIPLGYDRGDTEAMFHEKINNIFLQSPEAKYYSYFKQMYDLYPTGYIKILTAVGDHWPNAGTKHIASVNKVEALRRLGFAVGDIIVVNSGKDKIEYAINTDNTVNVLFDDKWSTIVEWEKAGGHGMFVPECYLRFEEAGHADRA